MKAVFIITACACIFVVMLYAPLCLASTEDDARTAISAAEQRIAACYIAVAKADAVGANVTVLLYTLDSAGMLLSRADLAFQNETFRSAYDLAVQSKSMLDGFDVQAESLREAAASRNSMDFWINIVGSSVGAVGVVVGGFVVWLWLKKRYGQTGQTRTNES